MRCFDGIRICIAASARLVVIMIVVESGVDGSRVE